MATTVGEIIVYGLGFKPPVGCEPLVWARIDDPDVEDDDDPLYWWVLSDAANSELAEESHA